MIFGLIKNAFIAILSFSGSIANILNVSEHKNVYISLSSHPCITQPTLTDLNSHEYNQGCHYYPCMVN